MKRRSASIDKIIGINLKKIRELKQISRVQLGKEIGVSYQQIQKYEIGSNRLAFSTAIKICHYLNCSLYELIHIPIQKDSLTDKEVCQILDCELQQLSSPNYFKGIIN